MPDNSIRPELALSLDEHIENRQRLKQEIKDLEELCAAHDAAIKAIFEDEQQAEYVATTPRGTFRATYNPYAERTSLDKVALVEAGVTTEQIKRGTKTTQFVRLDIREIKG
jgi:hypothetical protein